MGTNYHNKLIEIIINYCDEIEAICMPLKQVGIIYFSYLKVFNDGSRIEITNHPGFTQFYYIDTHLFASHPYESCPQKMSQRYISWSLYESHESIIALRDMFNLANGISILEKSTHYCELWHFAADKHNTTIQSFYFNSQDIFKLFEYYFKDKASHIIKQSEPDKIKIFTIPHDRVEKIILNTQSMIDLSHAHIASNTISNNKDMRLQLIELLSDCKRYYLGERYNNNYLTKREIDCLSWCSKGKSAIETALILGVSEETVKTHLKSVKYKLNCFKQSNVIKEIIRLGILVNEQL